MNKMKMSEGLGCYSSVKYWSGFSNISHYDVEATHTPTKQPTKQPNKISNKTWKFYLFMLHLLGFSKLKESYSMNVKRMTENCKYLKSGVPVSLLEPLDGVKKKIPWKNAFVEKKLLWKHRAFS